MQVEKWARLLLRRSTVLLVGTLIGALLGVLAAASTPVTYEAVATVLLTSPEDKNESGIFNAPAVRMILTNQTIASDVVSEAGLGNEPGAVSAQTFLSKALTVDPINNTNLFRVAVRVEDPQRAAKAATRVAERGAELMGRVWRDTAAGRRTQLERQVEESRRATLEAEHRLAAYKQTQGITRRSGVPPAPSRASDDTNLRKLEDEAEILRKVYVELGARRELARFEMESATPPLRVIDKAAVPTEPLPSTRTRTIALGLLAGLVLAACLVIAREWRARAPVGFNTRP